jgi:hypothetical protein
MPEELRQICVDRHGTQHEGNLSPGQIRKEVAAKMLRDAQGKLGFDGIMDKLASRIVELDKLFLQAIYEFEPSHLSFPDFNALLVGDAASVATPMTGKGAGKALLEASVLGDLCKAHPYDIPAILAGFEKARLKETQGIVRDGVKMFSNHHWISRHTVWDSGVFAGEPWESTEKPDSETQMAAKAGTIEIGSRLYMTKPKL